MVSSDEVRAGDVAPLSEDDRTLEMLSSAKAFIIEALRTDRGHWSNKQRWDNLGPHWKLDQDVALAAVQTNIVQDLNEDLPEGLRTDRAFLMRAVQKRASSWMTLPPQFERDMTFVEKMSPLNIDLISAIFDRFPVLRSDQSYWMSCLDSKWESNFSLVFERHAPTSIQADREVVLKAVHFEASCVKFADSSLLDDRVYVEKLLKIFPPPSKYMSMLQHVPHQTQLRWPDLVLDYF